MQPSAKIRLILAGTFAVTTMLQGQAQQTPTAPPPQQLAHVAYANGQLTVAASNSSLNQILRDIARETGMKITGGVTDERVFGQYGPAAPSKVLGELLDGTGSNMMLMHATATTPAELILTPRQGGVTPPNPNAYREDTPPPERPQYPITPQPEVDPRGGPANAEPARSPNEVKTPQQIYEQLERMRQQQQSNPQ
ncbi:MULTISPECIES: hypothetical protein [Acidobacteriaceae]|uniref:hypothetical protein n=1 Tax=Acidobacteriaceae TaxID=204434 RepID=UPI00131E6FF7|nr:MULTISPECIES: hypothetical protein [Acidobacteriaceae]MDW5264517.1 hypothetical protein [Edaphobacter sp.]